MVTKYNNLNLIIMANIDVHISFKVARAKHDCLKGFGICNFTVDIDISLLRGKLVIDTESNTAQLHFLSTPNTYGEEVFGVDKNVKLPRKAAEFLGYESVTLLRGEYPFNTLTSEFGIVEKIQVDLKKEGDCEC